MSPPPQGSGSKIGWTPGQAPDRTKPVQPTPGAEQGAAETATFIDTYFTQITDQPQIVYNGDRKWANVTLTLETGGPVAVGNNADLAPVLSGKGELLDTNVPKTFTVAKGTRLWLLATGANRVKREISPLPWLEQITGLISNVIGAIAGWVKR